MASVLQTLQAPTQFLWGRAPGQDQAAANFSARSALSTLLTHVTGRLDGTPASAEDRCRDSMLLIQHAQVELDQIFYSDFDDYDAVQREMVAWNHLFTAWNCYEERATPLFQACPSAPLLSQASLAVRLQIAKAISRAITRMSILQVEIAYQDIE